MRIAKTLMIIALLIGAIGYYNYNRTTSSLENTDPNFALSADDIFSEFEKNEVDANKKFLDKVIEVSGTVQSFNNENLADRNVTLQTESGMFGVICKLDSTYDAQYKIAVGEKIKIKGVCTGMLMDVVLIRCIPTKQK
jgi:hypothetical protein